MDCEVIDVWYCFSAEAAEARGCIDLQEQLHRNRRDKTNFGFFTDIFPL
jgi:hypothetical protein